MKTYKIIWEDGTERYRKLDDEDAKRWKALADSKTSAVASVAEGQPEPTGATSAAPKRSQEGR